MENMRLTTNGSYRVRLLLCGMASAFVFSGCVRGVKTVGPYGGSTPTGSSSQQAAQSSAGIIPNQATYARDVIMPALSRINMRISAYEKKVKILQDVDNRAQSLDLSSDQHGNVINCRSQATDLLQDFKHLQNQLLREQPMQKTSDLITKSLPIIEKKDIVFLEGDCRKWLTGCAYSAAHSKTAGDMKSVEASMNASLDSGDYSQVIRSYESLPLSPGEEPEVGISYCYGIALMKSGREREAVRVFNTLLDRIRAQGEKQWEPKLLKLLADLDFGLENYTIARSRYEDLERLYAELGSQNDWARRQLTALNYAGVHNQEVQDYAALLMGYLTYNPQRDGFTIVQQARAFQQKYPVSVINSTVSEITRKANEDAEKWFAGLLEQVDRLSADRNNEDALLLIERIPADILPMDKQAILKLKKNSLAKSMSDGPVEQNAIQEEVLQTTTSIEPSAASLPGQIEKHDNVPEEYVQVEALQETWDQGMALMQAKDYDKSIEIFTDLLNTSFGTRAGLQIEEASRLAAQDDRKKAAELFVKAGRSTNPDNKRELLLSSRRMLEDILRKYPRAGLEEKIKRNLNRIDQELATIE
jgi:tetratricopeptide (TPR) repeat protein